MVELDGRQDLLLQAHAQRLDRAVGQERRPLRHRAHRRLIANFARRVAGALAPRGSVSVVISAKAFTPVRTPAGGWADMALVGSGHADTINFGPYLRRMLRGLA